jgi:hypothetical protein
LRLGSHGTLATNGWYYWFFLKTVTQQSNFLYFFCILSHGDGIMCCIYSICTFTKFKSVYIITHWSTSLRCILGIFLIVPLQRQCHGESKRLIPMYLLITVFVVSVEKL